MTEIGNVIPVNIRDEVASSYIDYAMSVIVGRALPDVRDGLKPVHRRILYTMYEQGNTFNRPYKKSARIVGDVMGKYHPHGDQAIYDTLVRLAQPFNMRLLLVDGQGNFGSVDGDPPAAMRYTEVRLHRAAADFVSDIEKDTVDFIANYDDSEQEPVVLPARIPNLLVNGSEGIAVGMATKVPPHNLREIIDATIHLIREPEASIEDLMRFVRGPDFPTGGIIHGLQGIYEAYMTGRGVIAVRARCEIERNEKTGKEVIAVHELPYQVNKARLIEKIAALVREKRLEGIADIRDESDRRGMRIVIEVRRDALAEIVLNKLYKTTRLQSSFGIIMLALVAGRPQTLDLRDALRYFVDFRRDVVTRRTRFELRQAQAREHILLGLAIALDHLDAVITLIRNSAGPPEARDGLMTQFGLSQRQAQAILDMRLQRLTGLERQKVLDELAEVRAEIERLRGILLDETRLMDVIVGELEAIRDLHADARRTEIVADEAEISLEDLVADEDMVVTISRAGYVKRTPLTEYRSQRRGGVGRTGMSTKESDFIEDLFVASTHTTILAFTTLGRVHKLKVHDLPKGGPTTRGRPIVNLLGFEEDEGLATMLPVRDDGGDYIVLATEEGYIKRTRLEAYDNINVRGIIGIKLREGDYLIRARLANNDDKILLVSREGQSIQFPLEDVSPTGRATMGVIGMRLKNEEDRVVGMEVIQDERHTILTVTERGYGKRTPLDEYRVQGRGGTGIITIKTSDRNGPVIGARQVAEDDELVIVTDSGKLLRIRVADLRVIGRNTQGVRVMRLAKDERVAAMAVLSGTAAEAELERAQMLDDLGDEDELGDDDLDSVLDDDDDLDSVLDDDDDALSDADEDADGEGED
jgi:DNA gyrase subunit A